MTAATLTNFNLSKTFNSLSFGLFDFVKDAAQEVKHGIKEYKDMFERVYRDAELSRQDNIDWILKSAYTVAENTSIEEIEKEIDWIFDNNKKGQSNLYEHGNMSKDEVLAKLSSFLLDEDKKAALNQRRSNFQNKENHATLEA